MSDDALHEGTISRIARRAVDDESAQLLDWHSEAVAYDAYLPGRTLMRVRGTARTSGSHGLEWSAILKTTHAPSISPGAPTAGGRREALAYRSGLLDDIPGGLRAARAFEIEVADSGEIRLWLEDLTDMFPGAWTLEQYRRVARHLGHFNGGSIVRGAVPSEPWLQLAWAEYHSTPDTIPEALVEVASRVADDRVRRAFEADITEPALRLLSDQPYFIRVLGSLPQALCHHDAQRANLFARPADDRDDADGATIETVAIDWESIGPGALGAEVATLVSGTIGRGDWPAERADELDGEVFGGYLEGLRDAGWSGDATVVRLGYAAAVALRWWRLRATLRALTDPDVPAFLGRAMHVPRDAVIRSFVLFARYLLARADEARESAAQDRPSRAEGAAGVRGTGREPR
jgi:hypothetical protein